ncbi:MAG: hypothetical protein ABL883_05560 [Terricaulis sp.]
MRRRRGRAANAIGAVLIFAVMCVLAGLAAAAYLARPPPTDATTLCRTDAELAAHTIVLVDATDKLEPRHRRKLRAVLDQERARLAQYDRLTIMRLNVRRPQEPVVLFSKCLPRPPEQINPLFENARRAKARWDESFADALDRALRSAQSGAGARASPILAGLRAAAADPDFGAELPRRRLVLVSDLLEHDPEGFSLYVSGADYLAWRAAAPFGPPDLSGVAVRVVPLDRPEHAERQAFVLERFWPDYFDHSGAERADFDPAP